MLAAGEAFPDFKFNLLAGKEVLRVLFPGNSGGKWTIFLSYCGVSSCLRCRQQLVDVQEMIHDCKKGNLRAVAASTGNREQAVKTAWDLQISFPVAYGIDIETINILYGKKQPNSCPTGFLIDPLGKLAKSFNGGAHLPAGWLQFLDLCS
jgi:peroxiredoxin